jgi:hypothetical protein
MTDNTKILELRNTYAAYKSVRGFIVNAPTASAKYSLRAGSHIVKEGDEERIVHFLFLRDGTESAFQRIYNWFYADKQRIAAKELLCKVIMNDERPAEKDAKREKMLIRIREMERIAPDLNLRNVLYDLGEHDEQAAKIKNAVLELAGYADIFSGLEKKLEFPVISNNRFARKRGIDEIVDEAGLYWDAYITQNFVQFVSPAINNAPIDYGLVEEFCAKWMWSKREGASTSNFTKHVGLTEAQEFAVGLAVQKINDNLNLTRERIMTLSEVKQISEGTAPSLDAGKNVSVLPIKMLADIDAADNANSVKSTIDTDDGKGIIAFADLRKASIKEASYLSISNVVQGISMVPGCKSLLAAWRIFASAKPVCALAHSSALKTLAVKGKRAIKKTDAAIPAPKVICPKKDGMCLLVIKEAKSLKDISFDWQSELDVSDSGRSTYILARDSASPESTSAHFEDWLRSLGCVQKKNDGNCTLVQFQEKEVILASYQARPLNSCLTDSQIGYLEKIYRYAVDLAVSNGKSILLTNLFDCEELTVKRCVYAMLAPVRDSIAAGRRPAVHIRVTSERLRAEIQAGLESSLRLITPLHMRPLVEIKPIIDKIGLALPGMMMVTQQTQNLFEDAPHNRFSYLYGEYESGRAGKVGVRGVLSDNSVTRLYFFAEKFGLDKHGFSQVQEISDEYAEFFKAARGRKCLYVTIELLWVPEKHKHKDNIFLLDKLCAEIKKANKMEPQLKVCLVTPNKGAGDYISRQFC